MQRCRTDEALAIGYEPIPCLRRRPPSEGRIVDSQVATSSGCSARRNQSGVRPVSVNYWIPSGILDRPISDGKPR
jgi:hypothetical protein